MYIRRNTRFSLYKRNDRKGNIPIRIRISFNDDRVDVLTGYKIDPKFWIKDKEKVRDGFSSRNGYDSNVINNQLNEYRVIVNNIFSKFELVDKKIPTKDEVKKIFLQSIGRIKNEASENIFKMYDKFMIDEAVKNNWTKSTQGKFKTSKKKLLEFNPDLSFDKLDEKQLENYVTFLNSKKYNNSTIKKEFDTFRWFLRWASKKGYYKGNSHIEFIPKFKKVEDDQIICLNLNEIKKLQEKEFKEKILEQARDIFLFCCFTGLRYSDVAKLKHTSIKDMVIEVVTKKTGKFIKIELNKHSQAILDKYKDNKTELALPAISNNKMNEYLKKVGKECGLYETVNIVSYRGGERVEETFQKWELLTTHCGRRTFITNAIHLGINEKVIMKWTGHTTSKAMKPYEKIFDEAKQEGMKKFNTINEN